MPPLLGEEHIFTHIARILENNQTVGVIFEGPTNSGKTLFRDQNDNAWFGKYANVSLRIADSVREYKLEYGTWHDKDDRTVVILKTRNREDTIRIMKESGVGQTIKDIFIFCPSG
ncbi:MAG: hypothetical protein EOP45_11050 [Sphingobacteriaceae bacterium]|nr:MAG: hypothetical protein EOP45_11050 [Sphingobacteriaceae bacterium]